MCLGMFLGGMCWRSAGFSLAPWIWCDGQAGLGIGARVPCRLVRKRIERIWLKEDHVIDRLTAVCFTKDKDSSIKSDALLLKQGFSVRAIDMSAR